LGVAVREFVSKVIEGLLNRFSERRTSARRFWGANEGVALVLVCGLFLGLGILAAVAVAQSDGGSAYLAQSNAGLATSSLPAHAGTEVITQTVKLKGKTVRVVRRRAAGRGVVRTVARPSETILRTHTVTMQEVATVTDVQEVTVTAPQETVTVFETVTCKPKNC
jgi:Tfp pilus assembly protein PilN